MPVLVRNNEKGCSVFTDANSKQAIEWQGLGDVNGEDLQYIPDDLALTPAFMKALNKGIFEIVEASAETAAILNRQTEAWRNRQATAAAAARQVIDPATEKELARVQIGEDGKIVSTAVPVASGKHEPPASEDQHNAKEIFSTLPVVIESRQS